GGDTNLRWVARTAGDEYAGPCPFCGGTDRFRVQPNAEGRGRWWCRQCGDGERWRDVIDYVRQRHHLSSRDACDYLRIDAPAQRPPSLPAHPLRLSHRRRCGNGPLKRCSQSPSMRCTATTVVRCAGSTNGA
ncbi:MAG: hypothetical protein H7Y32_08520, partial [Chloroflexales bacterium]|nr:hypothetical protein [Chloroflexales bacterium]